MNCRVMATTGREKRQAALNTVVTCRILQTVGNLTSCATTSFSGLTFPQSYLNFYITIS